MGYRSLSGSRGVRLAAKERPPRQDRTKRVRVIQLCGFEPAPGLRCQRPLGHVGLHYCGEVKV